MRDTIDLVTTAELASRYRALLTEEWDGVLEKALQLLDDQLELSGVRTVIRLGPPEESANGRRVLSIPGLVSEEFLPLLQRVRLSPLRPVPRTVAGKPGNKSAARRATALRVAAYLMLQAHCDLRGESGLFRDIQSLVYLGTVYELLPVLRRLRLLGLHDLLVNVLAYHCTVLWHDEVSHQQYLLAALAGYTKDEELEGKSLLASFCLTRPEEHDYLTKAQACVFHYLEHRRYDTAKSFLLGVIRQAPPQSLGELQEMLDDVYSERKRAHA